MAQVFVAASRELTPEEAAALRARVLLRCVLLPVASHQWTSRVEVLDLLQRIARAVQKAREEKMGVLFLGD